MVEFARHSHSIPRAYLRGWSADGSRVWARRLLVPAATYPEWEQRPIRSLAAYEHLYTSVREGQESDDFERWINEEFEDPAAEPLSRAREGLPLSTSDLHRLAFYAAALDVRTPVSYLEQTARWNKTLPGVIQSTLTRVRRELRRAAKEGRPLPKAAPRPDNPPPFRVTIEKAAKPGMKRVRAEVSIGRELWLHQMRYVLTSAAQVLKQHQWAVMRPAGGGKWFTSDHPILRLNFTSEDKYDFGGGWGSRGSEIIFPLSPDYLLYTRIGHARPMRDQFTLEQTILLQRLLAARAHRWIIAHRPSPRATWFRPRTVDKEVFVAEEREWKRWHEHQSAAEAAGPAGAPEPED